MRVAILSLLAPLVLVSSASAQSTPSLQVAEWHRGDDLTPYYQAMIREATEAYRGDCVEPSNVVVWSGFYSRVRSGDIPQLQYDARAFSWEALTLRTTVRMEDFGFVLQ